MKITHKISMDLDRYSVPGFDAVCGDRNTRELEIALYAGDREWEIPAEASVSVRYQKPDGTGGFYDLLCDGSPAWGISGNQITVALVPQTLTTPGCVILTVCLTAEDREISTFQILMNVRPAVGMIPAPSGDYWYLSGCLPQPKDAATGQLLMVESVDSRGRVTALRTADAAGLTAKQINALEALLKLAVYRDNPAAAWRDFEAVFRGAVPAVEITLSSMFCGGTAGVTHQLTAAVTPENTTDEVVWSSSDETVATVANGLVAYVAAGRCTVTATAGTVSASCAVTVTAKMPTYNSFGVTCNLTNVVCSSTVKEVIEGGRFTAELTADDGYTLETVTVTMGGTDITASAYADGVISIAAITGAVVITAKAVEVAVEIDWIAVDYEPKAGYYKAGVLTAWATVYNTGLIAVGDAEKLHCTPSAWGNHYATFFDENKTYLSEQQFHVTEATEITVDIPENAVYFSVAYYEAEANTLNLGVDAENVRHRITNSLVSADRAITNVIDGSGYTATLTSTATSVTMGGVDITATAYADRVVTIEAVTGDVVVA